MQTHEQLVAKLMRRPGVRKEVERIEREEGELLDIGTQPPAVARLERALATGKHSPSLTTLRKYAEACGKQLVLKLAKPLHPASSEI